MRLHVINFPMKASIFVSPVLFNVQNVQTVCSLSILRNGHPADLIPTAPTGCTPRMSWLQHSQRLGVLKRKICTKRYGQSLTPPGFPLLHHCRPLTSGKEYRAAVTISIAGLSRARSYGMYGMF